MSNGAAPYLNTRRGFIKAMCSIPGRSVVRLRAVLLIFAIWAPQADAAPALRDGDIVFHTSRSAQSVAVQKATRSPLSHVGIVLHRHGKPFVLEAISPVSITPWDRWLRRGVGGRFVLKRLKRPLTADERKKLFEGTALVGRPYDPYFEWSDDRIYCSELVWKLYRAAGIELAPLEKVSSFDLTAPEVRAKIRERFPNGLDPDEPVISPAALFSSPLLEEIGSE